MPETFSITVDSHVFDKLYLRVSGRISMENADKVRKELLEIVHAEPMKNVVVDLAGVDYFDSSGAVILMELEAICSDLDNTLTTDNAPSRVRELLDLADFRHLDSAGILEPRKGPNLMVQVGEGAEGLFQTVKDIFTFIGATTVALLQDLSNPRKLKWDSLWKLLERAGSDAVPIVTVLSFLMGGILAFQAALQLRKVGANIFVADLVSVAMCWEMGPLMVAIIASGRLGAAFAAHIGTMQVTQEVDALRVMAIDPVRYLVSPRILAVALALPCLTLFADLLGILGGCFVSTFTLDLPPAAFFNQMNKVLEIADVAKGLGKSFVFGIEIAAIGCLKGFQVKGGAESVGKATTSAVVTCIFVITVTDAVFSAFFYYLPIAWPF
jgi:phospholipid/cholesterol/gamma-HCH transport system permease protein